MNQLIKLTKFTEKKDEPPIWANVTNISFVETGERKADKKKYTVVHFMGSGEQKILVTEGPEEINNMMLKIREIKIVL